MLCENSRMAASSIVLLYRIAKFRSKYYDPVCKYLVDIWGVGLGLVFLGYKLL
jgi:hypothetical protein